MPNLLTTLDRQWAAFAVSPRGRRTLQRWQGVEPTLGRVDTLASLTAVARDIEGVDLDGRDQIHLALLRLAATEDDARFAVLHLLHPALSSTARLYSDTWDHDEAVSMVVTAALERIVRYPHGLPRPAASIVRWVRRAMWKEAERQRALHGSLGRTVVLDEVLEVPSEARVSSSDEVLDLVAQAVHAGVLDPAAARLVVLHRVMGVPTAAIADVEGYPPSTIRQRRSRAEASLAKHASKQVA